MKVPFPAALAAVVLVAAAIGWGITHLVGGGSKSPASTHARQASTSKLPRGWSYIAVARTRRIVALSQPGRGATRAIMHNPTRIGGHLALLVHKTQTRWVQTYLPLRPNGVLGWIPRRSVKLLTTAWSLSVHLRRHRLLVVLAGKVVRRLPIGVGRSVTPTPTGTYFITELLKQPDPAGLYGPYAFGLSAYSGVLQHFGRGGNGQVGIHGTDEPALVGTDVSHGCIRLRNSDILWLVKRLPLGTPVKINHD